MDRKRNNAIFAIFLSVAFALLLIIFMAIEARAEVIKINASVTNEVKYIDITEGPESADIVMPSEPEPRLEYLGRFFLTFYCPCGRCNGYDDGKPRSYDRYGDPLVWGTVAVDPKVIPLQTHLVVDGYDAEFVARDTGGKWVQGKHIDIFVPVSHSEALKMCVDEKKDVWRVIQ